MKSHYIIEGDVVNLVGAKKTLQPPVLRNRGAG